mmetsp:Transcript_22904/g.70859  ORF Transcript_22904/g.70859 Transcript_22904/m.70859 type:complete len:235 (-) Transcript_22904:1942-2646(-)
MLARGHSGELVPGSPRSAAPTRAMVRSPVRAPRTPETPTTAHDDCGSVEGTLTVSVAASKTCGKGPGAWCLDAKITRQGKKIFDRTTTLTFGADDVAAESDAACADALRAELREVWRRVARCEAPSLPAAHAFDGARSFSLRAKKHLAKRKWRWTCATRATAPAAAYARTASLEFASDQLAAAGAAVSFRDELEAAWAAATRRDELPGDDDDDDDASPPARALASGSRANAFAA